jgi:hypothetical protein
LSERNKGPLPEKSRESTVSNPLLTPARKKVKSMTKRHNLINS